MTGFPTLNEKGKEYETTTKKEHKTMSAQLQAAICDKSQMKLKQKAHRQQEVEEFKREKKWGNLMEEIVSTKKERTKAEDKQQQQRKMKNDVMKELINGTQKRDSKGYSHGTKTLNYSVDSNQITSTSHKKRKQKEEFIPTAYLTWTPYKNSTIIYDVTAEEIDIEKLKKYCCMPSMMVFYKTKVATFGTYQLEQPLMINNKVVFGEKYTVFVIDPKKRLEKRLKITSEGVTNIGNDVVITSRNHTVTEMSEGLAIYLKQLPPYHNEDIFYQNTYHYIEAIKIYSFYDDDE